MLTDQERIDIVRYRIECAENTLGEIENHEVSTAELYPKAKELVAAIKEKVNQWLAENAE